MPGLLGEGRYQETLTNSCWDSADILLEERGMPLLLDGLHKQVALQKFSQSCSPMKV